MDLLDWMASPAEKEAKKQEEETRYEYSKYDVIAERERLRIIQEKIDDYDRMRAFSKDPYDDYGMPHWGCGCETCEENRR